MKLTHLVARWYGLLSQDDSTVVLIEMTERMCNFQLYTTNSSVDFSRTGGGMFELPVFPVTPVSALPSHVVKYFDDHNRCDGVNDICSDLSGLCLD